MYDCITKWTREDWAGPFVDVPAEDLARLYPYYADRAAAEQLGTVIRRADEVRTWRFCELGEEPTRLALDAMARTVGLTRALAEAQRLLAA